MPTWTFKLFSFFHFDEHLYSQMFFQFLDYFFRTDHKKYNYWVKNFNILNTFGTHCQRKDCIGSCSF